MNTIKNYGMTNYQLKSNSIMFKANKNVTGVFKRPAEEIENFVSYARERLNGEPKEKVTGMLLATISSCLGDKKYLFQLVDYLKYNSLLLAIEKDTDKAMEVVWRILQAKESQGKTYNEIVDNMIAELKLPKQKVISSSEALRSVITPQIIIKKGLKTSLDFGELSEYQQKLLEEARLALKDNKNVNLYTLNIGWGSYINPSSNPDMFLHVKLEDFQKMTNIIKSMQRMGGGEGIFELSILGSDKKAIIKIPAEELTRNMKIIDTSGQAGVHPFLIDVAKYLDKHPETIKEVETNVGKLDLASVDSSIMEKIKACK